VRDVLLIGKVYEAAGARRAIGAVRAELAFDSVVLDAPRPGGRSPASSMSTRQVADIAKDRPDPGLRPTRSPGCCASATLVHIVTLLEEMPVQETVDAVREMSGMPASVWAPVVVNLEREPMRRRGSCAKRCRPC
jgi:hypothetical protein